jgi:hypothetical protein
MAAPAGRLAQLQRQVCASGGSLPAHASADLGPGIAPERFYEAFGFVHLPSMLRPSAVAQLQAEADRLLGSSELFYSSPVERSTVFFNELLSLENNPALMALTRTLLGDDCIWTGSELNRAGSATPGPNTGGPSEPEHGWHADRPGVSEVGIRRVKWMFYLTPTSENAGALRCIPGSHTAAYHGRLRQLQAHHSLQTTDPAWADGTFGVGGRDIPAHVLAATPGDAVVLDGSLYHAVFNHQPGRTYVCLKFSQRPRTAFERASLWRNYGGADDAVAYPFTPEQSFLKHREAWVRDMVAGLPALAELARSDDKTQPYPDADISAYTAAKEYRVRTGLASLWDE